jgi:aldose 1-epimerase
MKYKIIHKTVSKNVDITCVLGKIYLSDVEYIEIEVMSLGAGIRRISYVNEALGLNKLLTLTYDDIAESCHNNSLAGLTIGPNAGRLKAKEDITFIDGDDTLTVNLPANEDGYKQIHGGEHNLAKRNWDFDGVNEIDGGIEVIFSANQEDGLDGWSGNRMYEVCYRICDNGRFEISLSGTTDKTTYINMTNHTYWLRDGLNLKINADKMVENQGDFLPIGVTGASTKTIDKAAVLNNAFLINEDPAAKLTYSDIPLTITMSTDAPAVVVYTGDYLDNTSILYNKKSCSPGCAIALEPQELYPCTNVHLSNENVPFIRNIDFYFSSTT